MTRVNAGMNYKFDKFTDAEMKEHREAHQMKGVSRQKRYHHSTPPTTRTNQFSGDTFFGSSKRTQSEAEDLLREALRKI